MAWPKSVLCGLNKVQHINPSPKKEEGQWEFSSAIIKKLQDNLWEEDRIKREVINNI